MMTIGMMMTMIEMMKNMKMIETSRLHIQEKMMTMIRK